MSLPIPPVTLGEASRKRLTLSCRDADSIPRVQGAGKVETNPETGARIQMMHNGLKVLADGYYGSWMTELISGLDGVHEPQEEIVFHSLLPHLPERATMIEIGAFWSYYTLWFLSRNPDQRRGIGLEMDPAHMETGLANARLNGLEIELVHGRIGARDAPAEAFETESSGLQHVPTFGLEGLMKATSTDRADLILCDAQGGEIDLLEGMRPVSEQGRVGILLVSTHHHSITGDPLTHQRALHMIEDLGGHVLLEHDVAESFSGDGLIVADFGDVLADWTPPEISRCRHGQSLFREPLFDLAEYMGKDVALQPSETMPAQPASGAAPTIPQAYLDLMEQRIPSYSQNLEDIILWRALKDVEEGFYVDVGAAEPTSDSVTRLFYDRGWRGINIDPDPKCFDALERGRPRDINLGLGIAETRGTSPLFSLRQTGLSTFDAEVAARHKEEGWDVDRIDMDLLPLGDILREHVPDAQPIHFLKIDVEGLEEQVLRSADWTEFRPWIMVVEATEPNRSVQTHDLWEHILLAADYEFAYFDGLNRFYVAREQSHLGSAFSAPPNPFDNFSRPSERELKAAQEELGRLHTEIRNRDTLVEQQAQEINRLHAELQNRDADIEQYEAELRAGVRGAVKRWMNSGSR